MKKSVSIEKLNKQYTNPMRAYKVLVKILSGILKVVFRLKIEGAENMPKSGPVFVCCNHMSNWDPIIVAVALKRPIHFMSKKELFNIPVIGALVKGLGAFPVDRETADITAIKTALTHIKHGNVLGIFPQGTRCVGEPPESLPIKSGTGMMVFRTQADVLPVSIYTGDYKVSLFKKMYVKIDAPIKYEQYNAGEKSQEQYQQISDIIFERICENVRLIKESAEGQKNED